MRAFRIGTFCIFILFYLLHIQRVKAFTHEMGGRHQPLQGPASCRLRRQIGKASEREAAAELSTCVVWLKVSV